MNNKQKFVGACKFLVYYGHSHNFLIHILTDNNFQLTPYWRQAAEYFTGDYTSLYFLYLQFRKKKKTIFYIVLAHKFQPVSAWLGEKKKCSFQQFCFQPPWQGQVPAISSLHI